MKNEHFAQAYVSTSQAAKILGLSVGTVQRMVETGVFKAFVTQGGHRRILSSSLNQFCEAQGFANPQPAHLSSLICILHASDQVNATLAQLSQWRGVKVITQPLDLMGLHQPMGALFIDARIAWVHGSPMHLQDTAARDAHIVIYNSTRLPPVPCMQPTMSPCLRVTSAPIWCSVTCSAAAGDRAWPGSRSASPLHRAAPNWPRH